MWYIVVGKGWCYDYQLMLSDEQMTESMVVALVSGLCVAIPSVIASMLSSSKATTLLTYRMEMLENKVENYSKIGDRVLIVEQNIKTLWKSVDSLKATNRCDKE